MYDQLLRELLDGEGPAPLTVHTLAVSPLPQQEVMEPPTLAQVEAQRMRNSFARFARAAWPVLDAAPLDWNWHHKAICDHLQVMFLEQLAVRRRVPGARQRFRRLLANMPPGTSKSRFMSVLWPAWCWLWDPKWSIICLSTTPDVALRDADLHQQLVESEWYRETFEITWRIRPDQSAKGKFATTEGGMRISKGFGAKIIGLRGDCILIDDPHDAKDISDVKRYAVLNAWPSVVNRVNNRDQAIYVGVCQRIHEDDWSALFLKLGAVEHLDLPAEYPAPPCPCESCRRGSTKLGWRDPRARADFRPLSAYGPESGGKVLHPARMSLETLRFDLSLGRMFYATQMQQRPGPADGNIFKKDYIRWIQLEQLPAKFDRMYISVDCAAKKQGAQTLVKKSRTALGLWGIKGVSAYLIDAVAEHIEPTFDTTAIALAWTNGEPCPADGDEQLQAIIAGVLARRALWERRGRVVGVYVEAKAAGPSVITALGKKLAGVVAVETGSDDKESRAHAAVPTFRAGNVMALAGQPWNASWEHELLSFPNGTFDDQVDQTTQIINEVLVSSGLADAQRWLKYTGPEPALHSAYGGWTSGAMFKP